MKRLLYALLLCLMFTSISYAAGSQSIYFSGLLKHFEDEPRNNEGYVVLLGYSYAFKSDKWVFDTGANIFIDSYSQTSGSLFSNISHDDLTYGYFRPMIGVGVTNKGKDYESDDRQTYLFVMPKLRIGAADGLFATISVMPTSEGWVSVEIGFSF